MSDITIVALDAMAMGMIYKVFEDGELEAEAFSIAVMLSTMPTRGLALTKSLLNSSFTHSLEEQLKEEEKLQAEAGATADYNEGVNAFLEKRKPIFRGE